MDKQEKIDTIKSHLNTWSYKKARQLKSCLYHVAMQLPLDQWPKLKAEIIEHYVYCCLNDLDREDRTLSKAEEIELYRALEFVTIVTKDKEAKSIVDIFDGYRKQLHKA